MTNLPKLKPRPAHGMTMADVVFMIKNLPAATTRKQGYYAEAISAVCCLAEITGRTPADIPATLNAIEKLLSGINPVLANLSRGGFYNLKSRCRRALHLVGQGAKKHAMKVELTPAWEASVAALPKYHRIKIGRFAAYCGYHSISPDAVTEALFAEFRAEIEASSTAKKAMLSVQAAATAWNYGQINVPGWKDLILIRPSNAKPDVMLPFDAFPKEFNGEFDIWLKRVRDDDENVAPAPNKPYRPRTIKNHTEYTFYAASVLVMTGMPASQITQLKVLLTPANIDKVLGIVETRLGNPNSPTKASILYALLSLASFGPTVCRKYQAPLRDRLAKIETRASRTRKTMTEKNRRVIVQFDDPANRHRLLKLSAVLMMKADAVKKPTAEAARQALAAVAIEVLLANPLRAENLFKLDLERHFKHVGHGKTAKTYVHIDAIEVKNGVDIDFQLPKATKALIWHYMTHYRPILLKAHGQPKGTNYLFPGTIDGYIDLKHGVLLLGNATERHVGVRLTTHQFRHLFVHLILIQQPGAYELSAKVLGHTDTKTTKIHYSGVEHNAAINHSQQLVRDSGAFGGPAAKKKVGGAF
jgi:integrase